MWVVDHVQNRFADLGVGYTFVVHVDVQNSEVDMLVWIDPESLDGHMTVDGYTVVDGGARRSSHDGL